VLTGTLLSARHVLDAVEAATGERIAEVEFAGRGAGDPAWEAIALETLGARVRFLRSRPVGAGRPQCWPRSW
jgi:sugar (pentulose or hexulose) kinase